MQPHTHTPRHSTTHNNTASLTSAAPGVARRSPPAILATTHSAHDPLLDAHTWSPQGGGQGGEGAGPKVNRGHHRERGQPHTNMGTHNAPPHSRHFPHRTQPPHMQQSTNDGMHRARWRQQRCPVPWVCDRTHTHTVSHTHQHNLNQTTPSSHSPPRVPGGVPTPVRSRGTGARAAITSQHTTCGDGDQWGAGGRDRARGRGGVHSENPQTHNSKTANHGEGRPPPPHPSPKQPRGQQPT